MKKVIIIGAGPAGLFCAYHLLRFNIQVDLYEKTAGVGKKFLIAGKSGLNLTHSEDIDSFAKKYGKHEIFFKSLMKDFNAEDVRKWCHSLGIETFIGSSKRVFPKSMKAAKLLSKWVNELKQFTNFTLYLNHELVQISQDKKLTFFHDNEKKSVVADCVVFATGGASWKKTGSNGAWAEIFKEININVTPFKPMNCGFEVNWSKAFIDAVDRSPIKNVMVTINDHSTRSELMLTPYGIEGTAIYSLSSYIRDSIYKNKTAKIVIDLRPDLSKEKLLEKLISKRSKDSLSNHLRKKLNLDKASISLLRELTNKEDWSDLKSLAFKIKNLELSIKSIRPIDEAISTGGGVDFDELTCELEFKKIKGFYAIGEMLDFEAPTGGYLLQGCFSSAYRVAKSIIEASL